MDDDKRQTQSDLLDRFRSAPIRMARSRNELFHMLAFYDLRGTWSDFTKMIDFTGVTPLQIYQVVLGRSPDLEELANGHGDYDPSTHLREALLSAEFRRHIQSIFLQAHANMGRDVFIHVPKCAGTDLILNLGHHSVPLPEMLGLDGWVDECAFLEIVAGLARAAASNDRLFAYGHMELGEYVSRAGVRPQDRIFTVIRDPLELLISQANYAVGRLRQDPLGEKPDTAEYLKILGLSRLPEQMSLTDLKDLTLRALLNPLIAEPNRACFYLGRETQCRYAVAMENLIVHNVEITTTQSYNEWLSERWGIVESVRHNSSQPILSNTEARRLCAGALTESMAEDQKLFEVVSWALRTSGAASVTGSDLVRLVGPSLIEALARNAIPPLPDISSDTPPLANLMAATRPKPIAMYLAPISLVVPGGASVECVLSAEFGAGGEGGKYRLDGWSQPEAAFTWTSGGESRLILPALPGEGTFIIRVVGGPFVCEDTLPFQHVDLLVDGTLLAACDVREHAVLECELPNHVLRRHEPLIITLRFPNAAQPRAVGVANDERVLALAVHRIAVLRVTPGLAG